MFYWLCKSWRKQFHSEILRPWAFQKDVLGVVYCLHWRILAFRPLFEGLLKALFDWNKSAANYHANLRNRNAKNETQIGIEETLLIFSLFFLQVCCCYFFLTQRIRCSEKLKKSTTPIWSPYRAKNGLVCPLTERLQQYKKKCGFKKDLRTWKKVCINVTSFIVWQMKLDNW